MDWDRKRQTVENLVHRIVVNGDEIAFELQYMPGQLSNNSAQPEQRPEANLCGDCAR